MSNDMTQVLQLMLNKAIKLKDASSKLDKNYFSFNPNFILFTLIVGGYTALKL